MNDGCLALLFLKSVGDYNIRYFSGNSKIYGPASFSYIDDASSLFVPLVLSLIQTCHMMWTEYILQELSIVVVHSCTSMVTNIVFRSEIISEIGFEFIKFMFCRSFMIFHLSLFCWKLFFRTTSFRVMKKWRTLNLCVTQRPLFSSQRKVYIL